MEVSELGKFWPILLNKETEWNFVTHSDLSVETKDKVDRFKVLRDILALIGHMIDTSIFRNTTTGVDQKVVRKCQNQTRTCHSV